MFGNVPHHRSRTPLRQGRGPTNRRILPLSTTLWIAMWTRDRIRLCSSRWAWRTAAWVVSSSGPQKSHRTQDPTCMLSSIKPDYAHIPRRPQRSPQSPTVPGGTQHSTAEGRSGTDAHVRQERSCSDGRPKLATAPATGPHRSSQAFGRVQDHLQITLQNPVKTRRPSIYTRSDTPTGPAPRTAGFRRS